MKNKAVKTDPAKFGEFYDNHAPAVYGHIVGIVKHDTIADRVLVKTFVDVHNDKVPAQKFLSPFTNVLNHSKKKSLQTLKAIEMFQACNSAHPVIDSSK